MSIDEIVELVARFAASEDCARRAEYERGTIKTWLSRLEIKPINTAEEIEDAMQAEIYELRDENERLRETLKKIGRVNACDYEYQAWARNALGEKP